MNKSRSAQASVSRISVSVFVLFVLARGGFLATSVLWPCLHTCPKGYDHQAQQRRKTTTTHLLASLVTKCQECNVPRRSLSCFPSMTMFDERREASAGESSPPHPSMGTWTTCEAWGKVKMAFPPSATIIPPSPYQRKNQNKVEIGEREPRPRTKTEGKRCNSDMRLSEMPPKCQEKCPILLFPIWSRGGKAPPRSLRLCSSMHDKVVLTVLRPT